MGTVLQGQGRAVLNELFVSHKNTFGAFVSLRFDMNTHVRILIGEHFIEITLACVAEKRRWC